MSDGLLQIPTIETERLLLRAPRIEDFQFFAAFYASEQADAIGGRIGATAAWAKFCAIVGQWALRGFGRWVVEEKATGAYCGHLGCHYPEGWPDREIAWSVTTAAQGRGIAFEAAVAARNAAYGRFGWATAVSLVTEDNARSAALAERLGARAEGVWTHPEGVACTIYRHPSPAALSSSGVYS